MQPRSLVLSALVLTAVHGNVLAAVGRTPGTFDVSATGEATYTIPIAVPPGVNGLTPQIALTYASRSRQSIAGYGWNISGAMAIKRCFSSMAQDGVARDVRNDLQDRFCLNGSKLRLVTGTYGVAGSEYRTETESFSRIKAFGVAGSGPGSFTVESKDGLIYEYGATADSLIQSIGQTTARSWALSRVRDRDGNEIKYLYVKDALGAYRLDSITYGSNATQGTPTIYTVDFIYESRPAEEVESSYDANAKVKEANRLHRIDVLYGTTLYRRYDLTYEAALSVAKHSRLASVRECAGAVPDCLSATTFLYEDSPGLNAEVNTGNVVPGTNPLPLDVNGDGRDDLVYPSATNFWMVMFANSAGGYDTAVNTGVPSTGAGGAIPFDYDSDKKGDLLVPYSGGTWWVLYGSASGLSAPQNTSAPATGTGTQARALDIDGDGRDDLVWADLNATPYAGGDVIRWRRRIPGGAFAAAATDLITPLPVNQAIPNSVFSGWAQKMPRRVPDFNGDGRDDLAFRKNIRRDTTSLASDGSSGVGAATTAVVWTYTFKLIVVCPGVTDCLTSAAGVASTAYFGDLNGDGKSDLLYYDDDGNWKYRYATGTAFTNPVSMGSLSTYGDAMIIDWDVDGYDDLLMLSNATNEWHVIRSTGEAFAAPVATGVSAVGANTFIVADLNGDGVRELAYRGSSNTWRYKARPVTLDYQDELVSATDAFGVAVTFSYAPTTISTVHTRGSGSVFPTQELSYPLWVVTTASATDGSGTGAPYTLTYTYESGRVDGAGRGFLGFGKRNIVDSRLGYNIKTIETYNQTFPYSGTLASVEQKQSSGTRMSLLTNTWANLTWGTLGSTERHFPYVRVGALDEHELNGTKFRTTTTTVATTGGISSTSGLILDSSTVTTESPGGASKTQRVLHTLPLDDTVNWCIGRPTDTAVTNSHTLLNGGAITRSFDAAWDAIKCRPTQRRIEPDNATWRVTIDLLYDNFGNVSSETVTGGGSPAMLPRTTLVGWGTDGHFPRSVKNALNQETLFVWNDAAGQPATVTDPNGIQIGMTYDSFARLDTETRPDGTKRKQTYGNVCGTCGTKYRYHVQMDELTPTNGLIRRRYSYFTQWDQVFLQRALLLGSTYSVPASRDFDARGRLIKEFVPYIDGGGDQGSRRWTYDRFNRVVTDGLYTSAGTLERETQYGYSGLTSTVTDPLTHATTQTLSAWGDLLSVTDAASGVVSHQYNAFGEIKQTNDAAGNVISTLSYVDVRGLRTGLNDMNLGNWTFVPDALGEVVSQTDAKTQVTTFEYDKLGRMTKRIEPDGTSNFIFGTNPALDDIGRLKSMDGPGYLEELEYDTVGRPKKRKITLEAVVHQFDFAYNTSGDLYTLTYPTTTGANRFKLKYEYSNGYLSSIREFTGDVNNTQFWGLNVLNARGQPTDEVYKDATLWMQNTFKALTGEIDTQKFGTSAAPTSVQNLSYTWDTAGNFKVRNDLRQAISETATYDALNRLTQMAGAPGAGTLTIGYDAIGNITSRSDVNGGTAWTYHATKKNAVTAAGTINYAYDANGNMTSRNGVTQTWNSANLPATVATATLSTQFSYAPDRSRWKQVATYSGTVETTLLIGGLLEKQTTSVPSLTSWKHQIATPSGEVQYVRRSDSTTETFYIATDHLGSSDAVVNSAGTVVVRTSFDVWGARRDDDWVGAPPSTELQQIADTTRHGFTGHDMLDNVGLIHMNGRVYDPAIGRFMSADPFVQPMMGTQGFNRYSYVGNRPLSYVDPTGFEPVDTHCDKNRGSPDCKVIEHPDDFDVPCMRCTPDFHIIGGTEKADPSHAVASATNDWRNVTSQSAIVSAADTLPAGAGGVLGDTGGWKFVPGEPHKVGESKLVMVGYIVRRQTMGILDFTEYKPGVQDWPRTDRLPKPSMNIEKMIKKAIRDVYKEAGKKAGNAIARGVRVDELYEVYMSYDTYAGDQAAYDEGHEPLCCRHGNEFTVVTPGAKPVLQLVKWRYEMAPGETWHPSERWVAPSEVGHGWELYRPISPFTP